MDAAAQAFKSGSPAEQNLQTHAHSAQALRHDIDDLRMSLQGIKQYVHGLERTILEELANSSSELKRHKEILAQLKEHEGKLFNTERIFFANIAELDKKMVSVQQILGSYRSQLKLEDPSRQTYINTEESTAAGTEALEKQDGKVEELAEKILGTLEAGLQDLQGHMTEFEKNTQESRANDLTPVVANDLTLAVDRLEERIAKCEVKLQHSTVLVEQTANHSEPDDSNGKPGEDVKGEMTGVDADHGGITDFLENMEGRAPESSQDKGHEPQSSPSRHLKSQLSFAAEAACDHEYENGFEYENLEESVWDTILFIGLPQTGILGSVYGLLLVFLNAFCQIALCLIINDIFTIPTIDTDHVSAMRQWRVSFGHSASLMNQFTHESFVSKVCNSPLSTQMDTTAAELMNAISEYLPEREDYEDSSPIVGPILPYFKNIGICMSLIAIFIWGMEISISIQKISHKRWAFKTVPVAVNTVLLHNGGSHHLASISVSRKIVMMTILFLELVVVSMLCFTGVFFIIRTIFLRDLLLNAAALIIVLQIDELFFTALVPHRSRFLLTTLKPLPRPLSQNFRGMSWSSFFSITLIGVGVCLSMLELQSQASILEDTRTEICGGNQYFIAQQDGAGVLTAAHSEAVVELEDTYFYDAMRNLVTDDEAVHQYFARSGSAGTSGVAGGPWSLLTWTSMGFDATISAWNIGCSDLIPVKDGEQSAARYYLHMLQDAAGDYSVKDCTEVLQYCNWDTLLGMRTRFICPVSCGCNQPAGSLVLGGSGCPSTCYATVTFNNSMWSRDCEDFGLDSPYWPEYGKGLKEFLTGYPFWTNDDGLSDVMLATHGCNLVTMQTSIFGIGWPDLCEAHDSYLKPLTYACPVSCGCRAQSRPLCPYICGLPA